MTKITFKQFLTENTMPTSIDALRDTMQGIIEALAPAIKGKISMQIRAPSTKYPDWANARLDLNLRSLNYDYELFNHAVMVLVRDRLPFLEKQKKSAGATDAPPGRWNIWYFSTKPADINTLAELFINGGVPLPGVNVELDTKNVKT